MVVSIGGDEYRIERRDVDTGELLGAAPGF
jgi:hypothetical protein